MNQRLMTQKFHSDEVMNMQGNMSGRVAMMPYIALVAAAIVLWLLAAVAEAAPAAPQELAAQYERLKPALAASPFKRPVLIESQQGSHDVRGEIHAVINQPFARVNGALGAPQAWCDVLILHLNTKYCRADDQGGRNALVMNVGKKFDQPLEDSYRLTFDWQPVARRDDFLKVLLTAAEGPLSTRDYRIELTAIPLDAGRTFLHLSYAYGFGTSGRLAMKLYLGTVGASKVGFTVTGQSADGAPQYVDGMRGLVERNTMRYYLAIEAYLNSLSSPPRAQFEKRINDWIAAVERYPRQLHEMDQGEYLSMKRREYQRQMGPLL